MNKFIEDSINDLTEENIGDLEDKYVDIFNSEFPDDINELYDIIISSFVKSHIDKETYDRLSQDDKNMVQISYSGTNKITTAVIGFYDGKKVIQSIGTSVKRKHDKRNVYVGMMIALLDCFIDYSDVKK